MKQLNFQTALRPRTNLPINLGLLLLSSSLVLFSCKSDSTSSGDGSSTNGTEEVVEIVTTNYILKEDLSAIKWTRTLDQKSMKRTMKIFGADVDVEMDAVTLNMNGEVDPVRGELVVVDDIYDHGDLQFDMKTFKFAQEKGNGLFDTKSYPTSTLKFISFSEKELGNYSAKCELTIQDHTEEIEFPVSIVLKRKDISVKGSFVFNTLNFPLRAPDQQAEINKDIISVVLDLKYLRVD